MTVSQFYELVLRPTLQHLAPLIPYSVAAEALVLATAVAESRLDALRQMGGGPALGVHQMEPTTHNDIWDNISRLPASKSGTTGSGNCSPRGRTGHSSS